ncbi:MAG: cell envelope integrity protein TolA, partial [Sulfuritalea sp.]
DPFQEQLKREAEQLTQRKQADSAAQEFAQKQAAQASAARSKAIADYLGRIRSKIRGNIVLPPEIRGNPEAVFDVTQLPSGEVLTVRLRRSSGNAALDAAIERAILKSSPLPKPQQADLFSRLLELRYRPLDE